MKYYVNDNAQTGGNSTGEHEVHSENCRHIPDIKSKTYLGEFSSCKPAVEAAKKYYKEVDGCANCSAECCHTR